MFDAMCLECFLRVVIPGFALPGAAPRAIRFFLVSLELPAGGKFLGKHF